MNGNGLDWLCYLAGNSYTAPTILFIFSAYVFLMIQLNEEPTWFCVVHLNLDLRVGAGFKLKGVNHSRVRVLYFTWTANHKNGSFTNTSIDLHTVVDISDQFFPETNIILLIL